MISYREKQLLMVQKMVSEESKAMAEDMLLILDKMQKKEHVELKKDGAEDENGDTVDRYEDLVFMAARKGYTTYIRAEDILSPAELERIDRRKEEIEEQFKEKVKLQNKDMAFLFSAVLLQIIKQLFLKLNLEESDANADHTDKDYKREYSKKYESTETAKRYYAPRAQIDNTAFVPYDIVKNTKKYKNGKETGLGLNGNNHRYKTVGHDPLLGLIFGTGNILTNTATFYTGPRAMQTVHIRYANPQNFTGAYVSEKASTSLMLEKVIERMMENEDDVRAALAKQIAHIGSDESSIAGIPIPFLSYILGSDRTEELARKYQLDYEHLKENLAVIGKQAAISEVINGLTALLHRIYLLWDEVKEQENWRQKAEVLLKGELTEFDQVRSRKIILYSNLIASSLNLAVCAGGGAVTAWMGNTEVSKELFSHCDIGGYIVTLRHLFTDTRFILKVKDEFILACAQKEFEEELEQIRNIS